MKKEQKNKTLRNRIISFSASALLVGAICVCLYVVIQVMTQGRVSFGGYSFFRVITGSMEPTLAVGELIMSETVEIDQVKVEDIVCFRSQSTATYGAIITHRVVEIDKDEAGNTRLLTRGDANLSVDGRYVTEENFVGRVAWASGDSWIAAILSFVSGNYGFLACIVLPVLLILAVVLRENVLSIKKDMQTIVETLEQTESEVPEDPVQPQAEAETQEDYEQMCERIRVELLEELKNREDTQEPKTE